MNEQYADYEDVLRKNREEELAMQEQGLSIRNNIKERRKKIREMGGQHMSAE